MITTLFELRGRPKNFFVTAEDPIGPWSEPVRVDIPGIDPDIAWDADGNCWVHYSTGKRIERCRIDSDTGALLDTPEGTWSGPASNTPKRLTSSRARASGIW